MNSDYTGGCIQAYSSLHSCQESDLYKIIDGIVVATTNAFLRLCGWHALGNLTGPGKHGRKLLRVYEDKELTSNLLKVRLFFALRRLNLVLYDAFVRHMCCESHEGTLSLAIGKQLEFADYFLKTYNFMEMSKAVSQCTMLIAEAALIGASASH